MTISVKDLVVGLTYVQVKDSIKTTLQALDFPVASWAVGRIVHKVTELFARVIVPWTDTMALFAASGFLDTAKGDWLTVVADQVYGVTRDPATYATGEVTLDNAGGGSYSYAAGAFRVVNPTSGKGYRNSASFTLDPLETDKVIAIEAVEIGSASSSAAGTITELETVLTGVTVTNDAAVVGEDEETDASLRARCRLKLGALSPDGPADAYAYVARTSELNGGVDVTRVRVDADSTTGDVTIYVAGPGGTISDVTTIQDAIDELATPLCIDGTVASAVAVTQNFGINVYMNAADNVGSADASDVVELAISTWAAGLPIGGFDVSGTGVPGKLFRNAVESEASKAIFDAFGVRPITVDVTTPSGDVTYADIDRVLVVGTVTVGVSQVSEVVP